MGWAGRGVRMDLKLIDLYFNAFWLCDYHLDVLTHLLMFWLIFWCFDSYFDVLTHLLMFDSYFDVLTHIRMFWLIFWCFDSYFDVLTRILKIWLHCHALNCAVSRIYIRNIGFINLWPAQYTRFRQRANIWFWQGADGHTLCGALFCFVFCSILFSYDKQD